jgi:hypothetical protein
MTSTRCGRARAGLFALAFLATTAPTVAVAVPIVTQDPAAFAAATAGLTFTQQDFEDVPGAFTPLGTSRSYPGFTIGNPSGMVGVDPSNFCQAGRCIGLANEDSVTFQFGSPIVAMSFYVADLDNLLGQIFVDGTLRGSVTSGDANSSSPGFVGIYDLAGSFSQILLDAPAGTQTYAVDTVRFAAAPAAVPEPTTLVLLGSGLIGALWHRRRR